MRLRGWTVVTIVLAGRALLSARWSDVGERGYSIGRVGATSARRDSRRLLVPSDRWTGVKSGSQSRPSTSANRSVMCIRRRQSNRLKRCGGRWRAAIRAVRRAEDPCGGWGRCKRRARSPLRPDPQRRRLPSAFHVEATRWRGKACSGRLGSSQPARTLPGIAPYQRAPAASVISHPAWLRHFYYSKSTSLSWFRTR